MFVRIFFLILFFNDFVLIPFCFTILAAVIFTMNSIEDRVFTPEVISFTEILEYMMPFVIIFLLFFVSRSLICHEQKISTTVLTLIILGILACCQICLVTNNRAQTLEKVQCFIGQNVIVEGTILSKEGEDRYLLRSNQNQLGDIMIKIPQYSVIQPGSLCKMSGTLVEPESFKDFDYQRYLFRKGIYSILEVKSYNCSNSGNLILSLRSNVEESINRNLPEPESSLLAGILFGSERVFTKEFSLALQKSGLSHIISASGYNVTLLASLVDTIFKKGNIKILCIIKICIIWIFALFSGLGSSIVRACTMSSIYFFSILLGRDISKGVLIIFCITVMIVINPFVIHDIGFLLSSSATIGLIFFPKCFNLKNKWVQDNLLPTVTCTFFTLPVVIYFFKKISLISILNNLLAAPIIQTTIYFGLFSFIFKPLYFFVYIQLNIFRYIIEISSNIDQIQIESTILIYPLILFLILFCIYKYPIQNGNYYLKKAKSILKYSH